MWLMIITISVVPQIGLSQDLIIKKDRTIIESAVISVTSETIEFRKYSESNGSVYTIPVTSVGSILYQDGRKMTFDAPPATNQTYSSALNPGTATLDNAHQMVLRGRMDEAAMLYSVLHKADSSNASITGEFAYTLALCGWFDAALALIEPYWTEFSNYPQIVFFTSQIFALAGYTDIATGLATLPVQRQIPSWLSKDSDRILQNNRRLLPAPCSMSREVLVDQVKLANRLTAIRQPLQAIAVFGLAVQQYPDEYLPWIGYSIALENTGLTALAALAVENAIAHIGNQPEKQQFKNLLSERSAELIKKQNMQPKQPLSDPNNTTAAGAMVYAGGMLTTGFSSFNMRMGVYVAQMSNVTIDAGIQSISGTARVNLGTSVYNRYKKLVYGTGVNASLGKSYSAVYLKFSAGPSFMNRRKTASLDIFWDINLSTSKKYPSTFGFSIGRSIYFGKRKASR